MITAAALAVTSAPADAGGNKRDRGTKLELAWGFLGGARTLTGVPFAYVEGDATPALSSPFRSAPYDGVQVAGLGMDLRFVVRGVRAGVGFARPYARFDSQPRVQAGEGAGVETRALDLSEVPMSFGYEHRVGPVSLYADLVGTAYLARAKVLVGGAQSTYQSRGFAFSARAGASVAITGRVSAYVDAGAGLHDYVDWDLRGGLAVRVP